MIQQRIVKTKPHLITQPQDKIFEIEITLFISSIYFLNQSGHERSRHRLGPPRREVSILVNFFPQAIYKTH